MKMKDLISKITSNKLARSSAIVFAGSMTANVASYIYHLLMGRLLGPSAYGELSSLFSILYLFTVPLVVVQTVLVKFISEFKAHGESGQAKVLLYKLTRVFIIGSIAGLPVAFLVSPIVEGFLHVSSTGLFMLIYVLFVFSLLAIPPLSALQGYQKFVWFSVFSAVSIIIKVCISIPLAHWGVMGVLIAALVSAIIIYILYYFPLVFLIRVSGRSLQLDKNKALAFIFPTLFTLLGITSMYSTDIILVRHYFSSSDAGMYAAIAILGKIIFFASSAVGMVSYPILSEQLAKGTISKKIITTAIVGVSGMSIFLTVIYFLIPDLIVRMLFGNAYIHAAEFLGLFGLFIGLFSLGNIISVMCLAIGKTKVWLVPFFTAIAQVLGILMFHESIAQVININIAISAIFAIGTLGFLYITTYEKI